MLVAESPPTRPGPTPNGTPGAALPACLPVKKGCAACPPTEPGELARLAATVYRQRATQLSRLARTSRTPCDPGYWLECALEADQVAQVWDAHLLELAITRNATHGLQLSQEDKRDMARRIYHTTPERDRDEKKKQLAGILSVSERTIREWLSRIDKDSKEARDKKIFDMWLACYSQQEIAEILQTPQQTIADILPKTAELPESVKPAANHLTDFEPPIYNIWKQQEKTAGTSHFGRNKETYHEHESNHAGERS